MEEGGPDLFAKRVGVHLGHDGHDDHDHDGDHHHASGSDLFDECMWTQCLWNIDLVRNGGDKSVGPVATSEVEIAAIH